MIMETSKPKRKRGRPKGSKNKKPSKSKTSLRRLIRNVPKEHAFFTSDGTRLLNLLDLADKLEALSEEQFTHHVDQHKDDFHVWVRDIMNEMELAKELLESKNKDDHTRIVLKHIVRKIR